MPTAPLLIRPYRREDLGGTVRLWQELGLVPVGPDGLTVDEALDTMLQDDMLVFVAEADGELVGIAFGTTTGPIATIHRATALPAFAAEAIAQLVDTLESRLAEAGARTVMTWLADTDDATDLLEDRGYARRDDLTLLRRDLPSTLAAASLRDLGGRMIDRGLWDALEGMESVKEIIERRVILPLAQPHMAARHGVDQPKAVVLFGPPGTGKTTFAKGIASRLRWPFVEIAPTELTAGGEEAAALARTFDRILDLDAAVVFVDEVEDLASMRQRDRRVDPKVTNEFLKQIPRFRDVPNRLLVCATNQIGRLDPAFIRPGRFDYLLPVGPPDATARAAIWHGYTRKITEEPIDVDALVDASELFTPADIEFAARKAAQIAFERDHFEDVEHRAGTDDFLTAIRELRPTLNEEMIGQFEQAVEEFGRY